MTNPQDNPGTAPPVSPNTLSSTPPSEPPKPRFRRQKMLARKKIASGSLRKVLNEKLQASQRKEVTTKESDSSSESEKFISASEGEEPGSSDTDKIQETPGEVNTCLLFSDVLDWEDNRFVLVGTAKNVEGAKSSKIRKKKKRKFLAICGSGEEEGMKSGGNGSGEAAEGLINLSEQPDEPGRLLKDLEERGMVRLLTSLEAQGWKDMVLQMDGRLARKELVEFMANGTVQNGLVTSIVKGMKVKFDAPKLGRILNIPSEGYDGYTRQKWPCLDGLPTELLITRNFCDTTDAEEVPEARAVQKSEMRPEHKVLFEFVNKCLLPRQERRHTANCMDLVLMQCLVEGKQINWHAFIAKLLDRVLNGSKAHSIPYGFILTAVLDKLNVPLKKWEMASSKEHFGIKTLQACDYILSVGPVEPGSS
ncbi:PREDICTED: uncharacterized protein LOC109221838, partial [Nicotiana attenuata]|uniref:uncharacterized protein LOC109221838 n=1 Tax=Nicotiana attenuata TaxID=49451 RepID=UPI0009045E90